MSSWTLDLAASGGPRYLAIADAIARDVSSGVLAEGSRLPTHRDLADQLGVTVGTVTRGYAEAESRGLIVGEVGRGTFVRARPRREAFDWADAARKRGARGVIDMSLAVPWIPPDGAEGKLLARTLEHIGTAERPLDELLAYDPATALRRHREVAARWIGTLGLDVTPEQIIVTNGAQHAMTVILATLLQPGDTVVTEELTYPGLKAVAHMLGLRVRGVSLDEEGIVPDVLDAVCSERAAQALYVVPTVQNPTGATMSPARRRAVAEVASRHDLFIIEDEIHVPMDNEPVVPVAAFAPERTLHVTTLCKWATFGLRVGFVAAPDAVVERIRSGVRSSLWMTAPLMVEIATRWIEDGTAARLGRRKAEELVARYEIVAEVFGDRFDYLANPRALHVWLRLPEPMRSDEFVNRARQRGVLVAGAEAFTVGRDVPAAVRVAIAAVPDRDEFRRGLKIIADLLSGGLDPYVQIV